MFFDCELVSQSYKPLFFSVTIPQFSLFLNFRYFSISVTFINFLSNFQIGFYFHFQIELTFSDWIFISPVLYRTGHFSIMVISFDLCLQVYFHFLIGLFFQFLNFLIGIILPIRKETFFHFLIGISFPILFYIFPFFFFFSFYLSPFCSQSNIGFLPIFFLFFL